MNFIFALIFILNCVNNAEPSLSINEMRMVADVIKYFNKPTVTAAMIDGRPDHKLRFANLLKDGVKSALVFLQDLRSTDAYIQAKDVMFLLDLSFPNADKILSFANATGKLNSPYRWLIILTNSTSNALLPNIIYNLTILPDSEVIYVSKNISTNAFYLQFIYKISAKRNWTFEDFAVWTEKRGLIVSDYVRYTTAVIRRKNLQLETIKVTSVVSKKGETINFDTLRNNSKSNEPFIACFWQIRHLFEFINVSYEISLHDSWGYKDNATWTSLIGSIAHGDTEISATMIFITKQRLEVLSYLNQPQSSAVVFVFREPRLSYQNNLFLLPFRPIVWFCILGLIVIIILALFVNALWESKKYGRKETDNETWLRPHFSDITIFAISAITQQGNTSELKGGLGRVVIFILLLICLFLYTSYSASIVVLLQSSSNQIKTLTDLLNSKLELGVEDTAYNRHYFQTATEPVRAAIYNKRIAPKGSKPNFLTLDEGVAKLQKEPFAFNMYAAIGYKAIKALFQEHEKCGLREIAYIQENSPWFTCKKTSHYKEMYKVGLYRLKESGIYSRMSSLFFDKKPQCEVRGGSFVSVNIVDFYPALLVLVYGALASIVLLLGEIIVHRRRADRIFN